MQTPHLVLIEFADAALPRHESYSPFCTKAHRALRAAGLPYERRHVGDPSSMRALNPKGQLPILLVDGKPVFDSTNILRKLDTLAPGALASTPEARLLEELADTALYGYVVASRWADDANWERTREAYFGDIPRPIRGFVTGRIRARVLAGLVARDVWRGGAAECWARLADVLDDLDATAPRASFWLGDSLSIADVSLFAQLHALRTPLTPAQAAMLAARPRLCGYLDRVHDATATPTVVAPRLAA